MTDLENIDELDPRLPAAEQIRSRFRSPRSINADGSESTDEVPRTPVALPFGGRYSHLKNIRKGNGTSWAFTDERKDRALEAYAESGVIYLAAASSGVSCETIRQHLRTDELFAEAWEEAHRAYCAAVVAEVHRRGVEGTLEPVIGRVGKDTDDVITYVRRYSDRLLEFEAKRHMPEYRDKQQVDMNVTGGVLVVHTGGGAPGQSIEEELKAFDAEHRAQVESQKALAQGAEPIDVTPRVVEPKGEGLK